MICCSIIRIKFLGLISYFKSPDCVAGNTSGPCISWFLNNSQPIPRDSKIHDLRLCPRHTNTFNFQQRDPFQGRMLLSFLTLVLFCFYCSLTKINFQLNVTSYVSHNLDTLKLGYILFYNAIIISNPTTL